MKKFLIIVLTGAIIFAAIWFAWHFYWVLGEGVKAGQLNNITKKGYIFKTYEGKLIQTGLQGGGPAGSVQSNEFRFSVVNESLANQLMSNSGKEFELHYKEYMGALPWRGVSVFVVDSIYAMRDTKALPELFHP